MKLLLMILLTISLVSCSMDNSFKELGYNDNEIKLINTLDSKYQDIIKRYSYIADIDKLLQDDTFDINKLEEYLKLDGLDIEDRLMIVNKGYINDEYNQDILNLMKTDYYIHSRLDRYLDYKAKNSHLNNREIIERVNANRDFAYYTHSIDANTNLDNLIIANKYYTLNEYIPDNLINIESEYGLDSYLDAEAYSSYKEMANDMQDLGLNIWITSAYRSYDKQVAIYNSYLENDSQEEVDTYSARPGYSDHQTGLVVDVIVPDGDLGSFDGTKEWEFLKDNAHKYGFIMRYPKNKEDITGYMYESWHYRYVGKDAANYIFNHDITFDEYYAYFIES